MTPLRRLLGLIAPFRVWVMAAVLLGAGAIGSGVGLMAVSAYLIAKAALVTSIADVQVAIAGVRFYALTRATLRYAERYITHRTTFRLLTHLRAWFYRAVEPLAPARLLEYGSGDLLARIVADIETLENFYVRVTVPPLVAAIVVAVACLVLGSFDSRLAIALLVFLLLTGVVLPLISHRVSRGLGKGLVETRAVLNTALADEIQGIAELLAFDHAGAHQAQVIRLGRAASRIQERLAMIRGLLDGLTALFTGLAALTVLILAIPLVTGGQLDGVILALIPLTAIASFEAVQPLAQAMQTLEASRTAAARLFELIDAPPPVVEPAHPSPTPRDYSIEVEGLRFRYPAPAQGQTPSHQPGLVLNGFSVRVPSGSRVAIVGPSGAGKSTLVGLLLRFWDYEAGSIRVGGHELKTYRAEDAQALIGVVPQHPYLFNTTLRDNLLLAAPDADDATLLAACRQAQLGDFVAGQPAGLDTPVGENGLQLSGGERQRIAIARAFLKAAPILILDEATTHLDAITEAELLKTLAGFMAGRTTIIISHRAGGRAGVDQVVELGGGPA